MGCPHCMNDAKPNNKHMTADIFQKALIFQNIFGGSLMMITGGEPTEHPQFKEFLRTALNTVPYVIVTTNGVWMQDKHDYVLDLWNEFGKKLMWQVTYDKKYYPIHIDETLAVFHIPNVVMCDTVGNIYPMGRASNMEGCSANASKCYNIRAVTRQVSDSFRAAGLGHILAVMNVKGLFCTPNIAINGDIKLGESDLCPPCSHISKNSDQIIQDILDFRCSRCDFINDKLPEKYRKLLGE